MKLIKKYLRSCIKEVRFRRILRRWKLLSFRKLLYFPHILNKKERRFFYSLTLLVIISGLAIFLRIYFKVSYPVAQVGKTYTEGVLKNPRTINPVYATQDADRDLARLIFSSILIYNSSGQVELDLAESLDISPDAKAYTLTLRKNVFWHDSEPLTVDDVLFTIKTIQNPLYKSPLRANWQGVDIEKLDQSTIRFTLRTPYAPFIENLTLGIIPKHLWEKISPEQALLHELNLKPVGSGPYKFERFKQAKDGSIIWYRMQRNSQYYRDGPYLNKIIFVFFKTEEELIAAWRKRDIEGFGPAPANILREVGERSSIRTIKMPRIFGVFFNEKKSPLLGRGPVKKAVVLAIDPTVVARESISGEAIPTSSPLPFVNINSDAGLEFNPDAARKLLKEDGWKDEDGDGILDKKARQKGKDVLTPLRFTLTTSDWPDLVRGADLIKSMLREVGIDVVVEKKIFTELETSVIRPRNFELLLFGQVYGYETDPFTFWHSSQIKDPGLNVTLYSNKRVDGLLEEARRTSNPDLREKKYLEFIGLLQKDIPAVFLYSQLYLYLLPDSLKGAEIEKISLPSDRFNQINKWHKKTKRVFK
ncbi:MAG: peptide ABC transporter substrate-binding protein [Candidatus Sungiibacteriota bacterium]|uniref:Peptide ABC transporter substrate-binding protein n=1 Tax=Candidatus Sungiibacteriota bacterium TaxID=2750080 RepID=A0A7T5RJN4_9BACT|nr:MAG: peptide ABC transporter substrate-binding protein [Candidatus Sungbacteria bacterium]